MQFMVYAVGHPGSQPVPGGQDVPPCFGPVAVNANTRVEAIKIVKATNPVAAGTHAYCSWVAAPKGPGG